MRKNKKLLALFVAMAMLVTVCVPFGAVFAADSSADATISITDLEGNAITGEVARNTDVKVTIGIDMTSVTDLYGYTIITKGIPDTAEVTLPAGIIASDTTYVNVSDPSEIRVASSENLASKITDGVLVSFIASVGRSRKFEVTLNAESSYSTAKPTDGALNDIATLPITNLNETSASISVMAGGSTAITRPGSGGGTSTSQSSARDITSFVFNGFDPVAVGEIDGTDIAVHVPPEADLTNLKPEIEVSEGATVSPASGEAQDFTEPVEYTVTAENGLTKVYTVTVTPDGEGVVVEEAPFEFVDLPEDHWARPYIEDLMERGIISGDADAGTVRPDEAITRQEAAKIAVVGIGLAESQGELTFADSDSVAEWAKGFVAAAAENDIVNGFEDNTFRPTENITREQFAAMMMRAFEFGESSAALTFTDADQAGWSKGYIAKAVELGIINGYEDGSFQPANNVTRAEAFKMLSVCLDVAEQQEPADDNTTTDEDNTTEEDTTTAE